MKKNNSKSINKKLQNKGSPNKKCLICENFDKDKMLCNANKNCQDTNFSKCDSYLIKDKLINF